MILVTQLSMRVVREFWGGGRKIKLYCLLFEISIFDRRCRSGMRYFAEYASFYRPLIRLINTDDKERITF